MLQSSFFLFRPSTSSSYAHSSSSASSSSSSSSSGPSSPHNPNLENESLRTRAAAGIPISQYALGTALLSADSSQTEGLFWLNKAADKDHLPSVMKLIQFNRMQKDFCTHGMKTGFYLGRAVVLSKRKKNGNLQAKTFYYLGSFFQSLKEDEMAQVCYNTARKLNKKPKLLKKIEKTTRKINPNSGNMEKRRYFEWIAVNTNPDQLKKRIQSICLKKNVEGVKFSQRFTLGMHAFLLGQLYAISSPQKRTSLLSDLEIIQESAIGRGYKQQEDLLLCSES